MRRRGPRGAVGFGTKTCEVIQITAISRDMKALRGTKHVCHGCATRFYDLSREPIVCPACGAHHVPDAVLITTEDGTGAQRFDKTGWRSRRFKHPEPEPEPDSEAEARSTEDTNEERLAPAPNEHAVLDEDPDEADISGLVGHHEPDPKEA
jgi:uncharacterized protein (TIGR02300 family)